MRDSLVDFQEWRLAPTSEWMTDLAVMRQYASGELIVPRDLTDRRLYFYFWFLPYDNTDTLQASLDVQLVNANRVVGSFPLRLKRLASGSLKSGQSTSTIADRQAGNSLGSFNVEMRRIDDLDFDLPHATPLGEDVRVTYHTAYYLKFITAVAPMRLRVACDKIRIVWNDWAVSYTNHYTSDLYLACLSQDPRA